MRKVQQGFTLIELIMVIVIIGILASVALPKFYDLQTDARSAKLKAIEGSIRSAASIGHSAALVKNLASSAGDKVNMEGTDINLAWGYPEAPATCSGVAGDNTCVTTNILGAAGVDPKDSTLTVSSDGTTLTIQVKDASTPATCQITYKEATSSSSGVIITPVNTAC